MLAGDPYETEALDLQRARQRRQVREVSDTLLEALVVTNQKYDAPVIDDDDRGQVEEALRSAADALLETDEAFRAYMQRGSATYRARYDAGGYVSATFGGQRDPMPTDAEGELYFAGPPKPQVMTSWLRYLILADVMADDYTDPRLPWRTE